MLDLKPRGRGFEPHRRHCVVSFSKNINPSLVLVQPRKTHPFITERLLMGRKESNQTKTKSICTFPILARLISQYVYRWTWLFRFAVMHAWNVQNMKPVQIAQVSNLCISQSCIPLICCVEQLAYKDLSLTETYELTYTYADTVLK